MVVGEKGTAREAPEKHIPAIRSIKKKRQLVRKQKKWCITRLV